jgi:hypothetical protein
LSGAWAGGVGTHEPVIGPHWHSPGSPQQQGWAGEAAGAAAVHGVGAPAPREPSIATMATT